MSGEKILEPGTELYSVATGRLSLLRKRSRDAARLMGEQDGFVAVHIVDGVPEFDPQWARERGMA